MSVGVMTVGVMSVGEITVGVMTVGVMRRPQICDIWRGITLISVPSKVFSIIL